MPTRDEAIEIGVDGQRLAGTLVAPATTIPGILLVHGWGGSQEQYLARAREVAALGCVSLTFDLRGHARSDGRNEDVSREDNLRDVLAAYDVLPHPAVASYRSAFVKARSLTYRMIEGADHGLSEEGWQRAYTSLLVGW